MLTGEACLNLKEEKEARRGKEASEMVMVHTGEARRGSFKRKNKGFRFGFWERHSVFRGEGEMRTEGIGN